MTKGGAEEEECKPLSHIKKEVGGGGRARTVYHKGASASRNVYMMSNDSPKIDLRSLKLERVIKASPDRKSQEEDNLVCVASSKSFLNGVLCNTAQNQGGPAAGMFS